jgi:hypothetical protein
MVKLFRLLGLLSQSIFLQFVHLVGLGAFLIAAALGYFRVPSWVVPIVAVVFGVLVDKYAYVTDVTGLLEKASKANERGGFLILVYAVITVVGYIVGAYGRHQHEKIKASAATPKLGSK